MSEKKRILFLTANPTDAAQLCLGKEIGEVRDKLLGTQTRENFDLKQQRVTKMQDLRQAIFEHKPQIVHFSGCGTTEGLTLEDDDGQLKLVSADALSGFFRLLANQVECVVLSGCYSRAQAEAISEHIKYVIGTEKGISDKSAINFSAGFYQTLGDGLSIEKVFELATVAIQMQNTSENPTPILRVRADAKRAAAITPAITDNEPIEIFYSYSHRDERLRQRLETHLAALRQRNIIKGWSDRKIAAGEEWAKEIDERLNSAQIILLLVSPDFIASHYCYNIEMERAIERHEKGEARVVPVILSPCDWHDLPFAKLQSLPTDGNPITSTRNRNDAFYNVALGIKTLIERMKEN